MIRYNKVTNDKINKTVRNYNAKISRLAKKNPYLALPEKITKEEIKEMSNTRKDLNRNLKRLQRFSKRGAENTVILPSGEMVSAYELAEIKRETTRVRRNLTKRINELSKITPTVEGKKQDYTLAEMGDMRLNNMIAKRNRLKKDYEKLMKGIDDMSFREYNKFLNKTINKQNYQTDIFRENYLDKMLFREAYLIGYDNEKIKVIKEKMSKLTNKQFLEAFDTEKTIQMVRDLYPKKGREAENYFTFEEQLTEVYDSLYENIDSIVADYSGAISA